jgi:hypothetical protein
MITTEQAKQLLRDMEDNRPFYIFMDEQDNILRSGWFSNEELALRLSELLSRKEGKLVNVLRYVGSSEGK